MSSARMAEQALKICQEKGADCLVEVKTTAVKELNIESNHLSLLRTNHDQSFQVKIFSESRSASASGNQFGLDDVKATTLEAIQGAKSAPRDEANVIAPDQGSESFSFGLKLADDKWALNNFQKLLIQLKARFPNLIVENSMLSFKKKESLLVSSKGTHLQMQQGYYEGFVMFTTKKDGKSSSFNYTSFILGEADLQNSQFDFLNVSGLEKLLEQSTEQTVVKKIAEKFEGDVIVTPHCMEDLLGSLLSHLRTQALMTNTSLFQGKVGQKVISDKFSLVAEPLNPKNKLQVYWNGDGYRCQNESIFTEGVLERYLLDQYGSQKLKLPASHSSGYCLRQMSGQVGLEEILAKVKKGVLLCRLSAGRPASNGDFSGVAKNSYYIENGKIAFPIGESMVSGNLLKMFNEIKDVSQESIHFGASQFPWTRFGNMVLS